MPNFFVINQPGNWIIEDNGIPGDNLSQYRNLDTGLVQIFAHPADGLVFTTVAGVNLTINFTDSLGGAFFTVGDLVDSTRSPNSIVIENVETTGRVTLVANGSITEGSDSDVDADIIAEGLVLSAGSSIGTVANPIETRISAIEAETTFGEGINISNAGELTIGGLSDQVRGLEVVAGGDMRITNSGTIFIGVGGSFDSIRGGEDGTNVTLRANGYDADIIGAGNGTPIFTRGNVELWGGRDISFGAGGTAQNVTAFQGVLFLHADRDVRLSGDARLSASLFSVGAGRNISVLDNSWLIGGLGGNVVTGLGGTLTLTTTNGISGSSGNVGIFADSIVIGPGSEITNGSSRSVTLAPTTFGRPVNVGPTTNSFFALELSDAELDRITTGTLIIGSDDAGRVTFTGTVTHSGELLVRSRTNIELNGILTTDGTVTLAALDNVVHFASATTEVGNFNIIVDAVDDDPGVGGTALLTDAISASTITITGNLDNDTLRGNGSRNVMYGLGGNDTLRGFAGDDLLDGGAGADMMFGGTNDDVFFVDNVGDQPIENEGEGNDLVFTTINYTLAPHVELLAVNTSSTTFAVNLTGNGLNNQVSGNAGPNAIDGGGGADVMIGLGGDDLFFVDNAGDQVFEESGGGADRVFAAVGFTLETGSDVEILSTIDNLATAAIDLVGNSLGQFLYGNAGTNRLDGGGGGDVMSGFGGDDFYFIRSSTDRAVEAAGGGTGDRVFAAVGFTLEVGSQVEILSTIDNLATTAINLTGNELFQYVFGNAGANTLDSGGGGDTMMGLGGDDRYFVRTATDRSVEASGEGNDRVFAAVSYALEAGSSIEMLTPLDFASTNAIDFQGNALSQSIFGNAGNNSLDGGGGGDTLVGLGGDDFFYIRSAADRAVETAGNGNDRVFAFVSFALEAGSHVEMLTTIDNLATTAINLTGNELSNTIFGNAGANVLDGKGGSDLLVGLDGADTFAFTTALGAGNVDSISGFVAGLDKIALDDAIFTGLSPGALPAGAFRAGTMAADADDRIIYDPASGALYFDADGVGGAAAVHFATLGAGLAIGAGDFVVI